MWPSVRAPWIAALIEVHESVFREFAGIIFNRIVRLILRLPFVDTQCGSRRFVENHAG